VRRISADQVEAAPEAAAVAATGVAAIAAAVIEVVEIATIAVAATETDARKNELGGSLTRPFFVLCFSDGEWKRKRVIREFLG
jgi:hypothetical protein